MAKCKNIFSDFVKVMKALADPNRIRVVAALRQGELCVCQIVELLDLAPSTVSKHMSILRESGLVESRKEGRWVYYRLPECCGEETVGLALNWVEGALANDRSMQEDARKVDQIVAIDPEELCQLQGKRC